MCKREARAHNKLLTHVRLLCLVVFLQHRIGLVCLQNMKMSRELVEKSLSTPMLGEILVNEFLQWGNFKKLKVRAPASMDFWCKVKLDPLGILTRNIKNMFSCVYSQWNMIANMFFIFYEKAKHLTWKLKNTFVIYENQEISWQRYSWQLSRDFQTNSLDIFIFCVLWKMEVFFFCEEEEKDRAVYHIPNP